MRWIFIILSGFIGGIYFPIYDWNAGVIDWFHLILQGLFSCTVGIVALFIETHIETHNSKAIRWFLIFSIIATLFFTVSIMIAVTVAIQSLHKSIIINLITAGVGSFMIVRILSVLNDKLETKK